MATIKSFSDLQQSKKLAEILPLESADMCWQYIEEDNGQLQWFCFPKDFSINQHDMVSAWSLSALLEQLPYEMCYNDGNSSYLQINKEDDVYQLEYTDPYGNFESIETDRYEHFVDACYETIIRLH